MNDVYFPELQPLTKRETKLREDLEQRVFTIIKTSYIELGAVLAEINERRLYKSTHKAFSDYSAEIIDMGKSHAYRYIEAAEVVKNLLPEEFKSDPNWGQNISQVPEIIIPQNESQARALVGMEPEQQKRVWFEAVETADGKITAAHVRKTARELGVAKVEKEITKPMRARSANKPRMGAAFEEAFNVFFNAVNDEIKNKWKETDRRTVVRYIDGVRSAISETGGHRIPDIGYGKDATNVEKLIEAGLTIYRMDKVNLIIETQQTNGDWVIHDMFEDVDTMEPIFLDLMQQPTNIRG